MRTHLSFLAAIISALDAAILSAAAASADDTQAAKPNPPLQQIIVVFKTHFDIGYTALARDVVQEYRTTMIDRTLAAIEKDRHLPKDQQFVWTVPGWPMTQMLWSGQDPRRKAKIEQAFRDGNLAVHALPFTTHTETLGLEDLVRGMSYSTRLSRTYDLELPRAAKMTDVPCHTWVMATMLKHAGVDFLHIGCNFHLLWLNSGMTACDPSGAGLGLCPIDSPAVSLGEPGILRYSQHYVPKQARVYVNLFNSQWHANFRSWWGGSVTSRVRLWAIEKYSAADALYQPAMEARTPLLAAAASGPAGSLPVVQSGVTLSRSGVAVTAFGPCPDGPGTLLRLWEQAGQSGDCSVQLPACMHVSSVQPVDLRGRPRGARIPVHNNAFTFPLPAFVPASFVLGAE